MKELFDRLIKDPQISKAIDYVKAAHMESMKEHKEFIACESPTFCEEKRAELYKERLIENGLTDVVRDEYGNVYGYRRGSGKGPVIFIEAHMDTVFPFGSVGEIRDEGGIIYAPGAIDNTRGMTAILAALRAMNTAGIRTMGDIIFGGTTREEGLGGLGGMRDFIAHGPKVDASVSVDGAATDKITCEGTGSYTYEITFRGKSGHAFSDFGTPNTLHAAARAVTKISDFKVPQEPKTTFCVSNFHAGTPEGAHAIADTASIIFNIRSNSAELVDKLRDDCFRAVQEAVDEECARWDRKDGITWESELKSSFPAGYQDHSLPIIQAALCCAEHFTEDKYKVEFKRGGCVNGNIAIAAGIPCVTIGGGAINRGIHSLGEYFEYTEAYRLPQEIVVLLCILSGVEGVSKPLI